LFQGRFKSILVDKDNYLLELTRYVVLNPVRAGMVNEPDEYEWSSYRAMVGQVQAPRWLETDGLLLQFARHRSEASRRYRRFVHEGIGGASVWSRIGHGVRSRIVACRYELRRQLVHPGSRQLCSP